MQKNICYVPKWGGAQKQDFATVLSGLPLNPEGTVFFAVQNHT